MSRLQVPRWTAESNSLAVAANTAQFQTLVAGLDQPTATGLEQELTVIRVVGALSITTTADFAAAPSIGLGIVKVLTDLGAPVVGGAYDPLSAVELGTRDWLWTGNMDIPANAFGQATLIRVPLDIRVKRRLKSTEAVRFVVTRPADGMAQNVSVSIDIRILIVIRM